MAPDDEYNSYIGGIYRLLTADASEIQIIERLRQIEVTEMEVSSKQERLRNGAEKLVRLNVSL